MKPGKNKGKCIFMLIHISVFRANEKKNNNSNTNSMGNWSIVNWWLQIDFLD